MLIIVINIVGILLWGGMFGAYLGFSHDIINLLDIKSWDEFIMLRPIVAECDLYAGWLGWGLIVLTIGLIAFNVLHWVWNLEES